MININAYIKKLENSPYGSMSNIGVAKEDLKALLVNTIETYCKVLAYNYWWVSLDSIVLGNFLSEEDLEAEFMLRVRLDNVYKNFIKKDIKEYIRGY